MFRPALFSDAGRRKRRRRRRRRTWSLIHDEGEVFFVLLVRDQRASALSAGCVCMF
jgi:hypothetical protein